VSYGRGRAGSKGTLGFQLPKKWVIAERGTRRLFTAKQRDGPACAAGGEKPVLPGRKIPHAKSKALGRIRPDTYLSLREGTFLGEKEGGSPVGASALSEGYIGKVCLPERKNTKRSCCPGKVCQGLRCKQVWPTLPFLQETQYIFLECHPFQKGSLRRGAR